MQKTQTSRLILPNREYGKPGGNFLQKVTADPELMLREQVRFAAMSQNFANFYDLVQEGTLLAQILGLTSYKPFMGQTLSKVARDASIRNTMAEILHGKHTEHRSVTVLLPWITVLADYFSSTPIPENLDAITEADASLVYLDDIVKNQRGFYDSVKKAVLIPTVKGSAVSVDGLEVTISGDGQPVTPRIVSASGATISHGDRVFYNGLPADRDKYLTLLMREGAKIDLKIRNSTKDKVYAVVPTINGIPIRLEDVGFYFDGFESSQFPLRQINPKLTYLTPGQTADFSRFFVNSITLTKNEKTGDTIPSKIDEYSHDELTELVYVAAQLFERSLSDDDRAMLHSCDHELTKRILYESRKKFVLDFIRNLHGGYGQDAKAREIDIYVSRPEVADGKASSQLDNPFLGSLGFMILEVSKPPVEDTHTSVSEIYRGDSYDGGMKGMTLGGGTRSMGAAGLAHISGGADIAARKRDFFENWEYDSCIHKVVGYVPLNLMSLR